MAEANLDPEIERLIGNAVSNIERIVGDFVNDKEDSHNSTKQTLDVVSGHRDQLVRQIDQLKADFERATSDQKMSAAEIARLNAEIASLSRTVSSPVAVPVAKPGFWSRIKDGAKGYMNAPVTPGSQENRWDALKRRLGGAAMKMGSGSTSEMVNAYFNILNEISMDEMKDILREMGVTKGRLLIESADVTALFTEIQGILRTLAKSITARMQSSANKVKSNNNPNPVSLEDAVSKMDKDKLLNAIHGRSKNQVGKLVRDYFPGIPDDRKLDAIREIVKMVLPREMEGAGKKFNMRTFNSRFKKLVGKWKEDGETPEMIDRKSITSIMGNFMV